MGQERGSILLSLMVLFALCALYLSSGVIAISLKVFQLQQWRSSLEMREAQILAFLQSRGQDDWISQSEVVSKAGRCQLFDRDTLLQSRGFQVKTVDSTSCYFGADRSIYLLSMGSGVKGAGATLYQYHFVLKEPERIDAGLLSVERQQGYWYLQIVEGDRGIQFTLDDQLLEENGIDPCDKDLREFVLLPEVGVLEAHRDTFFVLQGGRYLWQLRSASKPILLSRFSREELVLASLFNVREGRLYLLVAQERVSLPGVLGIFTFDVVSMRATYKELQDEVLSTYQGIGLKGNFLIKRLGVEQLILQGELRNKMGVGREEFLLALNWKGDALWGNRRFWQRSSAECGFQQEDYMPIPGWRVGCQRKSPTRLLYLH